MARDNPTWGQARIAGDLCLKLGIQVSPRTFQKYLLRDRIYSPELDLAVRAMGVRILKTPFRSAQANCYCERLIGSLRSECLDFLIPINEHHLRNLLQEYKIHYHQGRPHSSLGPGLPEPRLAFPTPPQAHRHQIPEGYEIKTKSILGGLHHEYQLERIAA
jgi:transposase InsO family protein